MSDKTKEVEAVTNAVSVTSEVPPIINDSPFVTEDDTFGIKIGYYKVSRKIIVEGVDEDFDSSYKDIKIIALILKYPSQGDAIQINTQSKQSNVETKNQTQISAVADYLQTEIIRLLNLVRKWDLSEELSNDNVMNLHPKIVKGILVKVRNEIGTDGIL